MPPLLDSKKSSFGSTATIRQQRDAERGQIGRSPKSDDDESNEKDENDDTIPPRSLNSNNEIVGDVATELDSGLIVWWDGPEDPDNPMNWSPTWKWVNICVISVISFLV